MTEHYSARPLESLATKPGTWSQLNVGVFRHLDGREEQIGEYRRNYPSLLHTFFAFRQGTQDLALYSSDYTCTRVMELPSCRDLGGETPDAGGFCPVDFFVPSFVDYSISVDGGPPSQYRKQMPNPDDLVLRDVPVHYPERPGYPARTAIHRHQPLGPLQYHAFGFVAGCIWGDDSSWKLEYLDLSQAAQGILRRDARFGYLPLAAGRLSTLIDMSDCIANPTADHLATVGITTVQRFDIHTGRLLPEAI